MDNVALLKNLYAAFGRGDIPTVLGSMSPDIKRHEAESNPYGPSGEPIVGPDAIVNQVFMKLGAEWTVSQCIVEGRYKGLFKATGKSMDAQACHVWDVKDGKITRFQQYVDTAKLQDVMGA